MSPNITDHLATEKVARIAGGCYLAYILASVLATMLANIGLGDAQQVYQAIVTNEGSFRLGLVIALTTGFLFLMAAWGLYVLDTGGWAYYRRKPRGRVKAGWRHPVQDF